MTLRRSLSFNLKDPNNPDLRARVLRGEVPGTSLVNLTAEQLASDNRRLANDKIRDDMKKECERGQASTASTDMFQCVRLIFLNGVYGVCGEAYSAVWTRRFSVGSWQ